MSTPENKCRRTANVAACSSVRLLSLTRSKPRCERIEIAQRSVLRRVDEAELLERAQRAIEIVDLLADGDELPVRPVLGDHEAVAVVDEAARRRHRLDAEAIALRQLDEPLVVEDLQLHEPRDEQAATGAAR